MKDEHNMQLAITEVVTKTVGTSVKVALSSQELSSHNRRRLYPQPRNTTLRLLSKPCHVDLSIKLEKFNRPVKRTEAWLYIEDAQQETGVLRIVRHLQPVHVVIGQPFQLTCVIESLPEPQITWFKNGIEILTDDKYRSLELIDGKVVLNVNKSQAEDEGQYEVHISNQFGTETSKTEVVVRAERPQFIRPVETSYTVEIGDEATVCFSVFGVPRPEITWSALTHEDENNEKSIVRSFTVHNRVDVIGGVEIVMASLKIKRVGVEHSRTKWVCRASNQVGYEERWAEIVARGSARAIVPLRSLQVRRGQTAKFRFKVIGWPRPEVMWSFADQPLDVAASSSQVVGTLESGEKVVESLLKIESVTSANEGVYTVKAVNKWNCESSEAKLTVSREAPDFTERFHDKNVEEGSELQLTATVTGNPLPSITWFRNDAILEDSDACVIQSNGDMCILTIKAISKDEGGRYKCVAENEAGLSKCVARVQVTEKKFAVSRPTISHVFIEKRNKETKDPPIASQRKQESLGASSADIDTGSQKRDIISKSIEVQSGDNATDERTSASSLSQLNEQIERPMFVKPLRDQELHDDEDCCFEIEISGKPEPQVQWYKSDKILYPSSSIDIRHDGGRHTLEMKKVQLEDAGSYTVQASNLAGKVFSSAILRVNERQYPPIFVEELQNLETVEGNSVCFECLVKGNPLPDITWFLGGVEVKARLGQRGAKTVRRSDVLTSTFLFIDLPSVEDCGLVRAVARNMAGSASSTASLVVKQSGAAWSNLSEESLNTANPPSQHQSSQPSEKVVKPPAVNLATDKIGNSRVPADERSHERQLTFIRTTRMGPGHRLSTVVGEIEYRAEMSVEDCTTDVVETRLLDETKSGHCPNGLVMAEFLCQHDESIVATPSDGVPRQVTVESIVQKTSQPVRWIVRKTYLNKDCFCKVEQWSVRSYVDCVEAMIDVSRNVLDNVKFAKQNVEFRIVLSTPCETSTWFKDGRQVASTTHQRTVASQSRDTLKPKYSPTTNESGLVHTLVVNNVTSEDEGIYTFSSIVTSSMAGR